MVPEQKENRAGYETLYTEFYDPSGFNIQKILSKFKQYCSKDIPKLPIETIKGKAEIKQIYRNPTNHQYLIDAKQMY